MKRGDGENYYRDEPAVETPPPESFPKPWTTTAVVGTRQPRIDGYERVSGSAIYPSDVILPGMLYSMILRCPHAHARVRKLDTRTAVTMPGVLTIIDSTSPEGATTWPLYHDVEPAPIFSQHCKFEGEPIAAVAAETPQQAADALRAIVVDYEVLPSVSDEGEALEPSAPKVHDGANLAGEADTYARGDIAAGFAAADVIRERTYRTEYEIHSPMELFGCVAAWDGPRLTVWESSQGVFSSQSWLARILDLPLANVRVIGAYMGGAFGAKLQPSRHTVIACLLAKKTARPVKLFISREEAMLCVGNRPGATMRLKAGVTKDGTLTALEFSSISSGGAYSEGGAGLVDWVVRDLYTCPNVSCETKLAHINAGPSRPFRAPGHPQGAWALEQMMDELANAINMDPVALRLKNIPDGSQARGGMKYTTTGLRQCLEDGARAFDWETARKRKPEASHRKRGVGMASCLWIAGGGGPPSTAIVKVFSDGSVNLNLGASDIGTGTRTAMAMIVAEELGIDPNVISVENADTKTTQFATPSGGSKTIPTESPAVREAAYQAKRQLIDMAAAEMEIAAEDLALANGAVVQRSNPSNRRKLADIEGLKRRRVVVGVGYRGPNPEDKVVNPFAAQFAEVEVNTNTGEVKVLRFLGAHDSGRVMNQLTYDNQVFGGITMGIGFAMSEERVLDRKQTGKMLNANLHDYKIPTMLDTPPEIAALAIDLNDQECNTAGAKGLGEPVTIPTAPAIANAIAHAVGIRPTATPMDPGRILTLLGAQGKEA